MLMISSKNQLEITRADWLESRGWLYYKLGELRGGADRVDRALGLIKAAHQHGTEIVAERHLS
jgi:hypothetical protein